jgi:hypothetical protein
MVTESASSEEKSDLGDAELGNHDSEGDTADKGLSLGSLMGEGAKDSSYSFASVPAMDFSR